MITEPEFKSRRRHTGEPVRILLVEDDPQFADLIQTQLRRMPWVESRLEVAGTLSDALAKLAGGGFGLVVTDLNLPDSSGTGTVEALARAGEQPIIVLTGDKTPALRASALEAGAFDFLHKDNLSAAALERLVRVASMQANTFHSLRESEGRFRSLVALSSDWYWEQDEELRFTRFEGRDSETARLALGKRRWEIDALTPVTCSWQEHRAVLEARQPFRDFQCSRPGKDGSVRFISVSGEPVYDREGRFCGYRGLASDVTRRKQGEAAISDSEARFRRTFEFAASGMAHIGMDRRFLRVNRRLCEILGYSEQELLGLTGREISHPDDLDVINAQRQRLYAGEIDAVRLEKRYLRKDGSTVWAKFTMTVERDAAGKPLYEIAVFDDITAQRDAHDRLRASEARFRSLTALSSDWYWEQDAQLRLTYMSNIDKLGLDPAAYLGRQRWDQPALNLSEDQWARHRAQLERHEPFHDFEIQRPAAHGGAVWISLSGEPVFDEQGRFKGYRGVGRDITSRKRTEALRELEHTVTRSLAEARSLPEALRGAMRAVCETQHWECGRYFAWDESTRVLRFTESWHLPDPVLDTLIAKSRGLTYSRGKGLIGRAFESGRPMWVRDMAADSRVSAGIARASGMHAALLLPTVSEGTPIGVLMFHSREIREPDERLTESIHVIGSQVGQFVQRKQAEEVLRESEARFRSLTSLSSDWYWEQDAELRFVATGGARDERAGITPQTHIGLRSWELPGTEIAGQTWEQHRAVLEARQPFRDVVLRRTVDGEVRYVSVAGEPVYDAQQRFVGYRGVGTDITDRRRGEEALRRFRYAMDATADGIHIVDCEGMRLIDVNETACRYLGYEREELLSLEIGDFAPGFDREKFRRIYEALFAGPDVVQRDEVVHRRKDGRLIPIEITRRGVVIDGRRIGVNVVRDITERRRIEERRAAHLRYQEHVARFGQSALGKRDPADLTEQAVQAVLEALGAEAVAYLEGEPGTQGLMLRALVGVAAPSAQTGTVACPPGSPLAQVMRSGVRVMTEGAGLPFAWSRELGSAALVPVRREDKVRGALCVCNANQESFGAEEVNFIEATASVLSTALQRIDSEGRLAYLAQFDPLTGLPNRALLADRFSQMIVQAKRRGSRLAVLFIDLDEFKMVNDTLGHAGGDALLKEVAVRLQSTVRAGDTVARISGDEFAIVLADLARPEDAALVAQKVIDRVAAAVDVHGNEVFVTASVGIAAFPGDGAEAETLIGAADAAMYRAKQSGRNAYQFFTAEINERSRARAKMGAQLRHALEREEFALVYQPKYRLADRQPSGAEALLRWKHPERGMVSPAEFIPVLEETGLIVPVGEWVIRRACQDLKDWQAAGVRLAPVSVNLSARQFRLPDLDARIKSLIAAAGVEPGLIELEITESQLMHDPDHAIRIMRALRDAGMRIAIDDFGTGYSSLAYLTRFPVGALKIDRSFVKDMASDPADATIVRTIVEMAHTLGFTVVAEGVETEQQADFLRLLRCEQAQGFLFARPASAAELAVKFSSKLAP